MYIHIYGSAITKTTEQGGTLGKGNGIREILDDIIKYRNQRPGFLGD